MALLRVVLSNSHCSFQSSSDFSVMKIFQAKWFPSCWIFFSDAETKIPKGYLGQQAIWLWEVECLSVIWRQTTVDWKEILHRLPKLGICVPVSEDVCSGGQYCNNNKIVLCSLKQPTTLLFAILPLCIRFPSKLSACVKTHLLEWFQRRTTKIIRGVEPVMKGWESWGDSVWRWKGSREMFL